VDGEDAVRPRVRLRVVGRLATDWNEVRIAYEQSPEKLEDMARRFGVARSSISIRVRTDGWMRRRRTTVIDARNIVRRMYRLIEKVLVRMERSEEPMNEKDAGVLNRMAATLERLMDVEAKSPEPPTRGAVKETAEMQQIRKTIARRLEQLGDF
jgi:hypothetical protein